MCLLKFIHRCKHRHRLFLTLVDNHPRSKETLFEQNMPRRGENLENREKIKKFSAAPQKSDEKPEKCTEKYRESLSLNFNYTTTSSSRDPSCAQGAGWTQSGDRGTRGTGSRWCPAGGKAHSRPGRRH